MTAGRLSTPALRPAPLSRLGDRRERDVDALPVPAPHLVEQLGGEGVRAFGEQRPGGRGGRGRRGAAGPRASASASAASMSAFSFSFLGVCGLTGHPELRAGRLPP
ncbi:hypothetical protein AVW11_28030 [Streptomyces amritsarensis]|uniref:Uncharacterized protein n=1 Tax=Streptomyces amritsarensis TaxID=681158 RepID=A0ABX3FV72_9ACTN|nr:hypothetical protein AVW11_28030 [Streptomyces amritsarensis]